MINSSPRKKVKNKKKTIIKNKIKKINKIKLMDKKSKVKGSKNNNRKMKRRRKETTLVKRIRNPKILNTKTTFIWMSKNLKMWPPFMACLNYSRSFYMLDPVMEKMQAEKFFLFQREFKISLKLIQPKKWNLSTWVARS